LTGQKLIKRCRHGLDHHLRGHGLYDAGEEEKKKQVLGLGAFLISATAGAIRRKNS